jgi:hypothetical protein
VYLHAGGAIGTTDEISVQCDKRFAIAPAGHDLPAAIRRSLSTLEVGPSEIMIPVYACVWTAPLATHAKVNMAEWIYGRSGSIKSGVAGLVISHQGEFSFDAHLESFESTALHMAAVRFTYKDALITIDDYVASSNHATAKKQVDAIDL